VIPEETPLEEIGESRLLAHLKDRIPGGPGVVLGVGDDAAQVETRPLTLVTSDSLVEGVHFTREWSPAYLVGRKALSVNLSDMGAMGGTPRYAIVSLCLPGGLPLSFLDTLYDGLLERAAETGVSIVGGNLAATSGPVVVDVTLLGDGERILLRSGALPGDLVVVTGTLGAAAEGLRLLAQGARLGTEGALAGTGLWTASSSLALTRCLRAQLDPSPPLAFARALAEQEIAHAAIDLSDGLSGDVTALCEASQVSAILDADKIPVDPHAAGLERARGGNALSLALHGGEDYELLLAIPPERWDALRDVAVIWDLPVTVVGTFAEAPPVVSLKTGSTYAPLKRAAFDHFRPRGERS
jgi:thiamine-monophosphate kinase